MSQPIQRGYLVLADLSGYTPYLAGVELDHAHEILTDLLETIIDCFTPLLTISKLEGDAVFAYASDSRLPRGEAVLDLIEATYIAFRDRRQAIQNRTTCTCRACRNIPSLDLKFIVHHGEYLLQKVHAIVEPIGSDVNLAHRLMKNSVTQATGWQAYVIYTAQALARMGLSLPRTHHQMESYDHLGTVAIECIDLQQRYDEISRSRRVFLLPDEADRVLEFDYAAPPQVVWEWFNDPAKRSQWMGAEIVPVLRVAGRLASGARNHCVHGRNEVVVEDLLDIKPFEYYTVEHRPRGSAVALRLTFHFVPSEAGGTHLVLTVRSHGPGLPHWAGRLLTTHVIMKNIRRRWTFESIDDLIRADPASSG
jgi:uncharacterized protein YndB with AHSA1/START domain/class 3 adenylate cyclase